MSQLTEGTIKKLDTKVGCKWWGITRELLITPPLEQTDRLKITKTNKVGPVKDTLLPREMVAVRNRCVLNQKGRNIVKVQIFGDGLLGWLEALCLWGAVVEVVVSRGGNYLKHLCHLLHPNV